MRCCQSWVVCCDTVFQTTVCQKNHLEEDTDAILETGIQVHYNVKIGEDIKLDELRKVYDAVLITVRRFYR